MSKQKMTPWFPANVKPVRSGVYETQFHTDGPGFSYWSGAGWCSTSNTVAQAVFYTKWAPNPITQEKRWRGLSENPNA